MLALNAMQLEVACIIVGLEQVRPMQGHLEASKDVKDLPLMTADDLPGAIHGMQTSS